MDDYRIIRALERELTNVERRKTAAEKEAKYEAGVEKRKVDLKEKIKEGKKKIKTAKKSLKKIVEKKKEAKDAAMKLKLGFMPKTRFIIEYSTNLTGDRKFLLTNKNIQKELEKLKKEKKKKSFVVGETVVYLNPSDKDRYGMKAVVKKLYIDPASDKIVYDIKFMNKDARDWKPLSKGRRKLKNVSSTYLYQDNSALGIWAM